MGEDWDDRGIGLAIESYFFMLVLERSGAANVEADNRRRLRTMVPRRSDKSMEYKWCSISVGLGDSGLPWIDGYKALPNYQERLKEVTGRWLLDHPYLRLPIG